MFMSLLKSLMTNTFLAVMTIFLLTAILSSAILPTAVICPCFLAVPTFTSHSSIGKSNLFAKFSDIATPDGNKLPLSTKVLTLCSLPLWCNSTWIKLLGLFFAFIFATLHDGELSEGLASLSTSLKTRSSFE